VTANYIAWRVRVSGRENYDLLNSHTWKNINIIVLPWYMSWKNETEYWPRCLSHIYPVYYRTPRQKADRCSSGMLQIVDWYLPTFLDALSVPSSGSSSWTAWLLKNGPERLSRNVHNYQSMLRNIVKERRSETAEEGWHYSKINVVVLRFSGTIVSVLAVKSFGDWR